jgi:hypothetical protein
MQLQADNASALSQIIVGSYDPVTKPNRGGKVYSAIYIESGVTYTIQFENTGTANANS